jgi:iron complex outermembrane receptor protein
MTSGGHITSHCIDWGPTMGTSDRSLRELLRRACPEPWLGILALAAVVTWVQLPGARAQEGAGQPQAPAQEGTEPAKAEGEEAKAEEGGKPAAEKGFGAEITVTGTRVEGRTATDTPAPVDYIDSAVIRSTGSSETGKILQLVAPSFNFSTTFVSDGTDIIRPATLRALGPDQVLVLVNGKRRHQQALVNVQQTIARGSAGYDVNSIPAAAIDHVEVLRDGAAAQYGSDAIAGVLNIILKEQTGSTELTVDAGQTYESDGEVLHGSINSGLKLGDKGFANLTFEVRDRQETNRAGPDTLRVSPPCLGTVIPEECVTQRLGDPDATDVLAWLNASLPAGGGEVYAFGGYSYRKGNSSGFFRTSGDGRTVPDIYPLGFLPTIITKPIDVSVAGGYRGQLGDRWKYDAGVNYGRSEFKFREENTLNVTYFYDPVDPTNPTGPVAGESPTEADTGTLIYDQIDLTLDLAGTLGNLGTGPLHVAAGAEWRHEGYQIKAGDEVSYEYGRRDDRSIQIFDQNGVIAQPGTQGFPGWSPREEVDDGRSNFAAYVDAEADLTEQFRAGAALRFEDYSDFGSTLNGKLSGRYEFSDGFSLRGTVSTGFRAPSVHQIFYSQRSTNLNAAGVLTDTLTALQGGEVTRAFGIPELKEETSVNFSAGLVIQPNDKFRLTVDAYRIEIDDRIVFSSNIQPEGGDCGDPFDPERCPIRAILDPFGVGQVLFFTNAIDTSTDGLDIVAMYDWKLGSDTFLVLEGALHLNSTEVQSIRSSSDILPPAVLFDQAQVTLIEEGQPGERATVSGTLYQGSRWNANVRFNYFGEVAGEGFTPGFKQTWSAKVLTDASLTYSFPNDLSVTVGGNNLFDVFPDNWDPEQAFPFPQLGFVYGWETLPFGLNGGSYYARLNYRFRH